MLCREPFNLTRQQFLDLDDWTVNNVYFRPNANADRPDRGYWPKARHKEGDQAERGTNWREIFYGPDGNRLKAMRTVGMSEEEIEAKFQNFMKDCLYGINHG